MVHWKIQSIDGTVIEIDEETLRDHISTHRIKADTPTYESARKQFVPAIRVPGVSGFFCTGHKFVDDLRKAYADALFGADFIVPDLVRNGKDTAALELFAQIRTQIESIHSLVEGYYRLLFTGAALLKRFSSVRVSKLVKPLTPRAERPTASDEYMLVLLKEVGYARSHWFFDDLMLNEIEYMLDALQILMEPDYVPLSDRRPEQEQTDRYIPPQVRTAVWRRDQGNGTCQQL